MMTKDMEMMTKSFARTAKNIEKTTKKIEKMLEKAVDASSPGRYTIHRSSQYKMEKEREYTRGVKVPRAI